MARGTYDETHKRIIDSAYQFFLENGFERANLRDLCRDAGITTGALYRHFASKEELFSALVQPTVDELEKMYSQAETDIANRLRSDGAAQMWSAVSAESIVDFIYDNFDALKLLLCCSNGTPYSNFTDDVVCMETRVSMSVLRLAKELGCDISLPTERQLHIICHAYVSSLFEAVMHNIEKTEMLENIRVILTFFSAGASKALGL